MNPLALFLLAYLPHPAAPQCDEALGNRQAAQLYARLGGSLRQVGVSL